MVVESVDAIRVVVWDSVKDSSLVRSKTGNKSVRILIFIFNIFLVDTVLSNRVSGSLCRFPVTNRIKSVSISNVLFETITNP